MWGAVNLCGGKRCAGQVPWGTRRVAHKSFLDGLQAVDVSGIYLCEDNTGVGHFWAHASFVQSHLGSKGELAASLLRGWRRFITK